MTNINEVLPKEQIEKYKSMGYSEQQIQEAMNELEKEQGTQSGMQQAYSQINSSQPDARSMASNTIVAGNQVAQNLVQWQLELDTILERVEHMLRGDKPKFVNGSLIFMPPESTSERIFTDFGVAEIMRTLSMYLNRNTILSNYDEPTINWKVYDFGNEIADLIFLKYEILFAFPSMDECFKKVFKCRDNLVEFESGKWGVEVENEDGTSSWQTLSPEQLFLVEREFRNQKLEKRKLYPMIVRELTDTIHSAYLRALNGGERLSLREARQVSQTESIAGGMTINAGGQPMRERSVLNPARYLRGKYF
jgi:hypothetical protein